MPSEARIVAAPSASGLAFRRGKHKRFIQKRIPLRELGAIPTAVWQGDRSGLGLAV